MILLTSTTDKIQLITSAAGAVDVYTAWADASGSPATVTLGRLNSHITTAATTDIVPSPAASTSRNVKNIKISNNHATVNNTVTLQHTDGSTVIAIEQVTLAPQERMGYEEGVGIRCYDSLGREKIQNPLMPVGGGNTADIVANAADTALTNFATTGSRVAAGSAFLFRGRMSKTAAGVAAATFNIRTGTAGTTADTARLTHTMAAQTAVVDDGQVEISIILRALGAAAIIESSLLFTHTGASVGLDSGIGANLNKRLQATSASFSLGASDYVTLTCNPGAAGVWTFQEALLIPIGLIA